MKRNKNFAIRVEIYTYTGVITKLKKNFDQETLFSFKY